MNNIDKKNDMNIKSDVSVVNYASYLIFLSIFAVLCSSFFNFIRGTTWSLGLLINMFVQGLGYIVFYVVLSIHIKKKYAVSIKPISKNLRIPTAIALILIIILNIAIFSLNGSKTATPILAAEVKGLQAAHLNNEKYYVIYGSKNCTFCYQMEDVYSKIYAQHSSVDFYYVDLSFVSISDPIIQELNVYDLPLMVSYQNGEEVNRIQGVSRFEDIEVFIKN